jgi:hypothetical protein
MLKTKGKAHAPLYFIASGKAGFAVSGGGD